MTTRYSEKTRQERRRPVFIPDPPKHVLAEMNTYTHLGHTGNSHHLVHHLGNPETTIVVSEAHLLSAPGVPSSERRIPDMLIAFDADPELLIANNSYIISEQGKPPDFVLEIASPSTARRDVGSKREDYRAMGIPEYWRFDETGEYYGTGLAGDLLVDGQYRPFPIETLADDVLQGYSPMLHLYIRWERGELRWHDPVTGLHIATFEQEREARIREQQARIQEQEARIREQQARIQEREARIREQQARQQAERARLAAEARVRELEAELERRRGDAHGV